MASQTHKIKIAAAIFDLDGTLLDTLQSISDTVNEILATRGYPVYPLKDYRYLAGEGAEILFRRVLPEAARTDHIVRECLVDFHRVYELNWQKTARPFPGVPELLSALSERKVRLSVLSNKIDEFTKVMIRELLPEYTFDVVLGARTRVPKKPDPAGAYEIAESIGIAPEAIAFVGDTSTDMKTAVAAGMLPIGVLWGFREEDELRNTGARVILREPMEMLEAI